MVANKISLIGILGIFFLLLAVSCGKDDPEKIAVKDREKILEYIQKNDIDAIEHETGVFYHIERQGSDVYPTATSSVRVSYTGRLLDGKVFDGPATSIINLSQPRILGFRYGIPLFSKGSKGLLLVPSGLGYGADSYYSGVPSNSVLIYEIEIIDFNK